MSKRKQRAFRPREWQDAGDDWEGVTFEKLRHHVHAREDRKPQRRKPDDPLPQR